MEPGWRPGDLLPEEIEDRLFEAARLYHHLTSGSALEAVTTSVRLDDEEAAYFDGQVECFRYDVLEQVEMLFARAVGPTTLRDWLKRENPEPRWRPMGIHRVVLTSDRLLVSEHGRWASYWHRDVAEYLPTPADFVLTLNFHEMEPMRLSGPDLASLTVTFASLLYGPERMSRIPEFARFDPNAR